MPTFREDTKIGGMVPMMKTDDINDQAITKDKIRDGNVTAEKLADGAVSTDKLPDGAIKTPKIEDGNITTSKLAEASVVTSKIADQNVTKEKIADQSVDNSKLSPEAVTYDKLKDKSVITEKLNDRAVTTEKIEEKAITNTKLGDQSVDGRVVREASIEGKHLGNNSVTNEKIAHNSVSMAELTPDVRSSIDKKADAEQVNNSLYDLEKKIGERFVVEGDVTNLPDEEDLTSVKESERDVLKLADRSYAPEKFSGKGYKILRRNIQTVSIAVTKIRVESVPSADGTLSFTINGKETQVVVSATTDNTTALVAKKVASSLQESMTEYDVSIDASFITLTRKSGGSVTPSVFSASTTGVVCTITDSTKREFRNLLTPIMINQPNTIYEIRYDFDLNGETIEMQEGCTLKFCGGSLKNGQITGNNSVVEARCVQIFDVSFVINGSWNVEDVYPEWFGAKGDGITDDYNAVNKCIQFSSNIKKHAAFKEKAVYKILSISSTNIFRVDGSLYIKGNNATISVGDVGDYECIIRCVYPDNYVHIENLIITTSETNLPPSPGSGGTLETNRRIDCSVGGTRDHIGTIEIDNVTINNAHGVWQYDLEAGRGYLRNCTINYTTVFSPTYDRTSIYINCNGFECYNNKLNGSSSARTGIEYHGNNIRVHDNYINNYNVAIDIVNDNSKIETISVLENLSLYNNYINSRRGVVLWFAFSNVSIDSIIIYDNTIITTDSGDVLNGAVQFYEVMGHGVNVNSLIIKNNHLEQRGSDTRAIIRIGSNTSNSSCEFGRIIIDGNVMMSKTSERVINYESWASGQNYKEISFKNNIIDCNNKKLLRGVDSYGCFKNTIFENNIVKNNEADVFLVSNTSGIYIFKSNLYDVEPSKSRPPGFKGTYINTDVNLGESNKRPVDNEIGFQYFDTTLGKPIYWNGTAWVDATGADV